MIVSFEEMRRVATGLWVGPMAAEDVRILPGAPLQGEGRHVVLVRSPAYDEQQHSLRAKLSDIRVLLAGSMGDAVIIEEGIEGSQTAALTAQGAPQPVVISLAAYTPRGISDRVPIPRSLVRVILPSSVALKPWVRTLLDWAGSSSNAFGSRIRVTYDKRTIQGSSSKGRIIIGPLRCRPGFAR